MDSKEKEQDQAQKPEPEQIEQNKDDPTKDEPVKDEPAKEEPAKQEPTKERFTKEKFIEGLKSKKYKHITIMTGAGISVAAGIPDFRSPDTGLYANLKEYDLPTPESIFNIDYFKEKPQAFYKLANEFLDMRKYKATYVHHFCKMLKDKGLLNYYLTQNIDNLEEQVGFTQDDMVQAHGANFGAVCAKCGAQQDRAQLEQKISEGVVMTCSHCGGPVKPNITFFGEALPPKFMHAAMQVGETTDLLIVIGTSLAVSPFNMVVHMVGEKTPKVLINLQNTATQGFDFDDPDNFPERILLQGRAQDTIKELAEACGWKEELLERKAKADEKHDKGQVGDLSAQMSALTVDDSQKKNKDEEEKQIDSEQIDSKTKKPAIEDEPESGPLMGFFAVEPIKECPHCIPGEFITCIDEFKDTTIWQPCACCGHQQENWICLRTKTIGCSRYVNNHMLQGYEKGETGPIVLSFADFSFWCYACDSYVVSKHLNHVNHFYPQKFGKERVSHMQEYAGIMASKAPKKEN